MKLGGQLPESTHTLEDDSQQTSADGRWKLLAKKRESFFRASEGRAEEPAPQRQFPYPPTSRLRRINQNHNSANQDIHYKKRPPPDPNSLPQQSVDQKPPSTTSISLAPLSLNCSALHLNTQQLTQHSELPLSLPPTNLDDISISIQFNLHHS
ncbi:hypothetical protein PGTUg99_037595 [Puccinia graminis f. sp. tritici]|uniref:Uncharacterized protein n=1 Tax=Puccinia graminis f. sp. tritici TaxID=56615 RepID=A0A5B0RAS8_PUCGR|nr:hypothetical protein PGTUg99_037595 [Puccinia graminis f. sp. tritici]